MIRNLFILRESDSHRPDEVREREKVTEGISRWQTGFESSGACPVKKKEKERVREREKERKRE